MKILAVAGGSGCGKTFFTKLLVERLLKTEVLPLDSYYYDRPDDIPIGQYDFDSPNAFDFELYKQHLLELSKGNSVEIPNFCYKKGKRKSTFKKVEPGRYLIIEGLHVLFYSNIRKMLTKSFYLESPLEVAVCRRCLRDINDHSMTAEHSLNQYLKFVRPVFFELIQPTKKYADLVVENNYESRLDLFLDNYLLENQL